MSEPHPIKNKYGGKCAYCGVVLGDRWHKDHIVPAHRGGTDDAENLNPSCSRCNFRKGGCTLEEFRSEIAAQHIRLLRDSAAYRLAMDYGLITPTDKPVEFYFEKLARRIWL